MAPVYLFYSFKRYFQVFSLSVFLVNVQSNILTQFLETSLVWKRMEIKLPGSKVNF